ncbi:5569_t:CDS:2 [Racocetra persica]|uniref:5569_t:CDS:1 n=1 Tax=Racocetra persica TaxID=160502 RepID=A0ACA9KXW9_9GLOM|nr:5569_t:CDS:2 [Racocetra persica]
MRSQKSYGISSSLFLLLSMSTYMDLCSSKSKEETLHVVYIQVLPVCVLVNLAIGLSFSQ